MKVLRPWLTAPHTIEHREEEINLLPNTVLLEHVCSAPSQGTALHMYRGEHLKVESLRKERPWPYPWLQGFAYGVGRVVEIGSEVKNIKPGQLFHSMKLTSPLSVVSPNELIPLPEGLDPAAAALLFQATVALPSIKEAEVALGDVVLVTGQGPIGIFAAQFCKLAGAWRVLATDLYDKQLSISRQVGVDVAVNARTDDVMPHVRALTEGRGVDLAVEASGSPKALTQCAAAARRLARIAVIGMLVETAPYTYDDFSTKALELVQYRRGRQGGPAAYNRLRGGATLAQLQREEKVFTLDIMKEGRLKAKELITHRFALKDLAQAWEFIDAKQGEYCQVLLVS